MRCVLWTSRRAGGVAKATEDNQDGVTGRRRTKTSFSKVWRTVARFDSRVAPSLAGTRSERKPRGRARGIIRARKGTAYAPESSRVVTAVNARLVQK